MAHIKLSNRDIFTSHTTNVVWFNHDGINYRYNRSGALQSWDSRGNYLPLRYVDKIELDNKVVMYCLTLSNGDILRVKHLNNGKLEDINHV